MANELRRSASQTPEEMAATMQAAPALKHWKAPSPDRKTVNPAEAALDDLTQADRVDFTDLYAVKEATRRYLEACVMAQRVPTMAGLACACGVSRKTLYKFASRDGEVGAFLQQVQSALADALIQGGASGVYHPILSIFLLRNSGQDYTNVDQLIVTAKPDNPLESDNPEELKKYVRNLPDISDMEVENDA